MDVTQFCGYDWDPDTHLQGHVMAMHVHQFMSLLMTDRCHKGLRKHTFQPTTLVAPDHLCFLSR